MPDGTLEERLAAVERALVAEDADADTGIGADPDADVGVESDRLPRPPDGDGGLQGRVTDLEEDVAELEAAVQAVRGYVGEVKHVNDEVEDRADAALAKAETVERMLTPGTSRDRLHGALDAEADEEGTAVPDRLDGATGDEDAKAGAGERAGRDESGPPGTRPVEASPPSDDGESGLLARLREVL